MEKQLEIVLDSLEERQVKARYTQKEINKLLEEQKNVLTETDIDKLFEELSKEV